MCEVMEYPDDVAKAHLASKLEGSARAWLVGQGKGWRKWTLKEMKDEMIAYFGEENRMHARKLKAYRQGSQSLTTYNDKFKKLAAACGGSLTSLSVKDIYLENLKNDDLAQQLKGHAHYSSLQQLAMLAMELEPTKKATPYQNFNRE